MHELGNSGRQSAVSPEGPVPVSAAEYRDESALCLKVDQTKSIVEAYNQIQAELQLAQDPILGGKELAQLSDEDMRLSS